VKEKYIVDLRGKRTWTGGGPGGGRKLAARRRGWEERRLAVSRKVPDG